MATISSPRSGSPAVPTSVTSPSAASTSNTPTSSVRPSIDLSSNATAQPISSNQRRNRAALRDYYNLKSKPSPAPVAAVRATSPGGSTTNLSRTGSVTSTTSTSTRATITTDAGHTSSTLPSALDDPSFDAESYVGNLLKTSSLRDILRTESSLVSEIRNLDGERKALVYDNYSKLIIAVGTIGEMQKGIVDNNGPNFGRGKDSDSGLGKMRGLETKLDDLMNDYREINGKQPEADQEHRKARAEDRRRMRETRKKKELVSWVLNAPTRLKTMVDKGERDAAEEEWSKIQTILTSWEGVKGVGELREQCSTLFLGADERGEDGIEP